MSSSRYPTLMIFLHWLTLFLIVLVVFTVLGRELVETKATRQLLLGIHQSLALLIPIIALIRLALRLTRRQRIPRYDWGLLQDFLVKRVHGLLYLGMLAIPVLGWALVNAKGHVASLLWVLPLPELTAADMDMADQLAEWHETAAWLFLGLIGLHALAALWHHYHKKDDVLRAMLP
ncbi:cytochrome b [Methylovorus sp. MP688]|uniref:cytochrome b n=1 Tax=Methylovorus sp. (strain MP688) TaxID=887061 RepID=UPI0001EC4C8E|nr:cytochrome b [Methylovorus sp. MP688]ADQ85143.1 cytochrome B561 [Methylovorus sp. MP688]